MQTMKENETFEHFGIQLVEGESAEIIVNKEFSRSMHGLSTGLGTIKKIRAIIDYDPDFPYFVVRKSAIR